jgi:7-keto-8-aminopelargonate synthetase-like enzyme
MPCDGVKRYVHFGILQKDMFVFMKRFFGPTGRGTEEHFGMIGKIDIINSTLGKALGGAAGGYTTGPKALIDLLRQRSRPYLFSNTLPPFVD